MDIDHKTQDYIRGQVINVPNYEEWKSTHQFPSLEEGEHYVWSTVLNEKFQKIRESMYIDGLPVTDMAMTSNGNLLFEYYHHTQDNLYPLGSVHSGCAIEDLEKLSEEQLKNITKITLNRNNIII